MIGTKAVLSAAPQFCECGLQMVTTYRGVYECPTCYTEPRKVFAEPEDVPLSALYPNREYRRRHFR